MHVVDVSATDQTYSSSFAFLVVDHGHSVSMLLKRDALRDNFIRSGSVNGFRGAKDAHDS